MASSLPVLFCLKARLPRNQDICVFAFSYTLNSQTSAYNALRTLGARLARAQGIFQQKNIRVLKALYALVWEFKIISQSYKQNHFLANQKNGGTPPLVPLSSLPFFLQQ